MTVPCRAKINQRPAADHGAVAGNADGGMRAPSAGEAVGVSLPPTASIHPHDPVGCRWIEGDPKRGVWRYCQHEQQDGSPYCPHHYVKVPHPRQAEQAA